MFWLIYKKNKLSALIFDILSLAPITAHINELISEISENRSNIWLSWRPHVLLTGTVSVKKKILCKHGMDLRPIVRVHMFKMLLVASKLAKLFGFFLKLHAYPFFLKGISCEILYKELQ